MCYGKTKKKKREQLFFNEFIQIKEEKKLINNNTFNSIERIVFFSPK